MPTTGRKSAAFAVVVAIAALVVGCARDAPQLPPDLSHLPPDQRLLDGDAQSPEGQLGCEALKQEAAQTRADIYRQESVISANRGQNQAAVYAAGFFPPAALAARTDEQAKKTLDGLQAKSDRIDRLSKAKGCARSGN